MTGEERKAKNREQFRAWAARNQDKIRANRARYAAKVAPYIERKKEEILRLYESGLGSKRIAKAVFGKPSSHPRIIEALKLWGVYVPGRDKGGGANRGKVTAKMTGECINAQWVAFNAETRRVRRSDDAWALFWNREVSKKKAIEYYWKNPEQKRRYFRERHYVIKNNPEYRARRAVTRGVWKKLRKIKARERVSSRIYSSIKTGRECMADGGIAQYIGCSFEQLKQHIQSQFIGNMNWNNYGKAWHIDHIVPSSYYDHSDPRQVQQAWHWTNLRPLWAKKNIRDGNRRGHGQPCLPMPFA